MSNLGQEYWECRQKGGTHKGYRGKRQRILSLHTCFKFSLLLLSEGQAVKTRQMKFEWGQLMDCVKNGVICSEQRSTISVLHSRPQLLPSQTHTRVALEVGGRIYVTNDDL